MLACLLFCEEKLHIIMKSSLIPLERQDVIRPLINDLSGDFFLAAHGVGSHDAASKIESFHEFRNCSDLVGFICGLELTENQAMANSPGIHHVNGRLAVCPIMGSAQCLAINGHDVRPGHE